jgi:hypothetical protein
VPPAIVTAGRVGVRCPAELQQLLPAGGQGLQLGQAGGRSGRSRGPAGQRGAADDQEGVDQSAP